MPFPLTNEQEMVRLMVEQFARREVAPGAAQRDRESKFPVDLVKQMGELGLLGMMVPAAYGGSDVGAVAYALAVMELARACGSAAVTMSVSNLSCEPLLQSEDEEQKQRLLTPLASGQMLGAIALTEPGAGSNLAEIATRARKKGSRYLLNGTKLFVTNGGYAGVVMVLCRTGEGRGLTVFAVPKGSPGLTVGSPVHKMGLLASNTVELNFEDCEVPEENRIGKEGEGLKIIARALDGGRVGIAAQSTGMLAACLDEAIKYARERKQFGKPLASHQAVQFMIAEIGAALEAARLLTLSAASLKQAGKPFAKEASIAKMYASEALNEAAAKALQIHGGYGYTREFPIERIYRDARVTTIYEGTNQVQRMIIARELLKNG